MSPPLSVPELRAKIVSRSRRTEDGCWLWEGYVTPSASGALYGRCRSSVVGEQYAHRVSYAAFVGPIPEGLSIDHLCRNTLCVNPAHLDVVTPTENNRRGNGWSGRNAQKTHCLRGHEFTPENTYWRARGYRMCRSCRNAYESKYRARLRAEARAA